ncbi:MAG: BlaI/MecI/CopY family transcriptional regulator [Rhodothermales bacterium]|nr:BlaI/MecI/CopY family transcriptional regulator [Rhodothermales bacterium]
MAHPSPHQLSRRERQIMDILYRQGEASAAEVLDDLPDPPSYSAVRAHLRILEEKGHVEHRQEGPRYIYFPAEPIERAKQSALRHMVSTFFSGSVSQAVAALLDLGGDALSEEELTRLSRLIDQAHEDGH